MLYKDIVLAEANHLNISVMILMKLLLKKCGVEKIPSNRGFKFKISINNKTYFQIFVDTTIIFVYYLSSDPSELQKLYEFLVGRYFENKQLEYYSNGWNIFVFGYDKGEDYIVNPTGRYKSYKVKDCNALRFNIWMPTRDNDHRFVWWCNNDCKSDDDLLLRYLTNTNARSSYRLLAKMNYKTLFGVGINMIDYLTLLVNQSNVEVRYYDSHED